MKDENEHIVARSFPPQAGRKDTGGAPSTISAKTREVFRVMVVERLVSAGGVLIRGAEGETEIILCGRPKIELWGLPKGTPNAGETLEETALREVEEETGIKPKIVSKIGATQYWFTRPQDKARCSKTVHYYLMTPVSGDTSLHDSEYEEVAWFPIDSAIKKLTYVNDVQMVKKAADMVAERKTSKG